MPSRPRTHAQLLLLLLAFLVFPVPSCCQSGTSQSTAAAATSSAISIWGKPPAGIPENAEHPDNSTTRPCFFPPDPAKPGEWRQATNYDGYYACPPKPGALHSMCCQTHPRGGNVKDEWCYNGLCYLPATRDGYSGLIAREACTDPTWKDPGCLNVCMGTYGDQSGTGAGGRANVRKCDNVQMFCCGDSDQIATNECCNSYKGFSIDWPADSTFPIVTNSTGPPSKAPDASNIDSSTTESPSGSAASAKGKKQSDSVGLSGGIIAGIVGVNVLLVALAVVGIMWFRQRRRWKKRSKEHMYDEFHNRSSMLIGSDTNFGIKAELDAAPRIDELDGYPRAPGLQDGSLSELGSPVSRPGTPGRLSRMGTMMSARPLSELPGSEVRTGQEIEMETGDVAPSENGISSSSKGSNDAEERNDSISSSTTDAPQSAAASDVSPASAAASSSKSSGSSKDSSSLRNRSSSRASKSGSTKSGTGGTANKDPDDHSIYELP